MADHNHQQQQQQRQQQQQQWQPDQGAVRLLATTPCADANAIPVALFHAAPREDLSPLLERLLVERGHAVPARIPGVCAERFAQLAAATTDQLRWVRAFQRAQAILESERAEWMLDGLVVAANVPNLGFFSAEDRRLVEDTIVQKACLTSVLQEEEKYIDRLLVERRHRPN